MMFMLANSWSTGGKGASYLCLNERRLLFKARLFSGGHITAMVFAPWMSLLKIFWRKQVRDVRITGPSDSLFTLSSSYNQATWGKSIP